MTEQELELIREIVDSPTGYEVIGQMPASDVCAWLGALLAQAESERQVRVSTALPRNIGAIITLVLADAYMRRDDAAQSGAHHDGGANQTEREVRMYQHGLARTLPPEWQKFADDVERAADPEFAEYQRLARKFGAL